ncbi:MAG: DUF1887 family protein [Thiohalocapsa sp.]|nr:DUF1887 family protein [Thiohalocapsa sp.]
MTIHTHLCLVSAHAAGNLMPVLGSSNRPARVVLLIAPGMQQCATWLGDVLIRHGIRVDEWMLDDAVDVAAIGRRITEFLEAERELVADGGIALNVSGGARPAALAAYEACRSRGVPAFFAHPQDGRLTWMQPHEAMAQAPGNAVTLDDFLAAHGSEVVARRDDPIADALRGLTDWLFAESAAIARPLGILHRYAGGARRSLVTPPLPPSQLQDAQLLALIERFAEQDLIAAEDDRLRFADEAARAYVDGGWLGSQVHRILQSLRADRATLGDVARSLDLERETSDGERIPNQLDVACIDASTLYVVECNIRRWKDAHDDDPGAHAGYRFDMLAALREESGARALIATYRDLRPHLRRRAADLGIRVCAGSQLADLPAVLFDWLSGSAS